MARWDTFSTTLAFCTSLQHSTHTLIRHMLWHTTVLICFEAFAMGGTSFLYSWNHLMLEFFLALFPCRLLRVHMSLQTSSRIGRCIWVSASQPPAHCACGVQRNQSPGDAGRAAASHLPPSLFVRRGSISACADSLCPRAEGVGGEMALYLLSGGR